MIFRISLISLALLFHQGLSSLVGASADLTSAQKNHDGEPQARLMIPFQTVPSSPDADPSSLQFATFAISIAGLNCPTRESCEGPDLQGHLSEVLAVAFSKVVQETTETPVSLSHHFDLHSLVLLQHAQSNHPPHGLRGPPPSLLPCEVEEVTTGLWIGSMTVDCDTCDPEQTRVASYRRDIPMMMGALEEVFCELVGIMAETHAALESFQYEACSLYLVKRLIPLGQDAATVA